MTRVVSCGVIVTDGHRLLIGHATGTPRWDIPKGEADPDEQAIVAARRELLEETGLTVEASALQPLGEHRYLPKKDLMLYAWHRATMPEAASLVCRSTFTRNGHAVPEFDRFACLPWMDALPRLGKSMQYVLSGIARDLGWSAPGQ